MIKIAYLLIIWKYNFYKLFILLIDMKKHDWVIKLFLNFKNITLYITKYEVDMKHIINNREIESI